MRRVLATYFVDSVADNTAGICAADNQAGNSACTIRLAIQEAEANPGADTIQIADGNYVLDNLLGSFDLGAAQDIAFVGNVTNPTAVVIDGDNQSRLFDIFIAGPTNVSFQGLTLQNGLADDGSGGAGINGGAGGISLSLSNVIMSGNVAAENSFIQGQFSSGGAINTFGSLTIDDSMIMNNRSTLHGGGIDYSSDVGQSLTIRNSTISGNQAGDPNRVVGTYTGIGYGGGVLADDGDSAVFENVTITGNTAGDSGGGVYMQGTRATFTNTDFLNNVASGNASGGGGLYVLNEQVNMTGGRFEGNTSVAGGAGMEMLRSGGTIENVTYRQNDVTGNGITFEEGGGGLAVIQTTMATLRGLTIDNNTAPAGAGVAVVDSNVTIESSSVTNNTA
ncbi:MAG: hypothetical protein AB8B91_20820, partial [Rubripirellula sp.]